MTSLAAAVGILTGILFVSEVEQRALGFEELAWQPNTQQDFMIPLELSEILLRWRRRAIGVQLLAVIAHPQTLAAEGEREKHCVILLRTRSIKFRGNTVKIRCTNINISAFCSHV